MLRDNTSPTPVRWANRQNGQTSIVGMGMHGAVSDKGH